MAAGLLTPSLDASTSKGLGGPMNAQLNHVIPGRRSAELRRAGDQAQLTSEVRARTHKSREPMPSS